MDDFNSEIIKGLLRGIGYILSQIIFGTICYWVGWPICKIITLGKYPASNQVIYIEAYGSRDEGFWCSAIGLLAIVLAGISLMETL